MSYIIYMSSATKKGNTMEAAKKANETARRIKQQTEMVSSHIKKMMDEIERANRTAAYMVEIDTVVSSDDDTEGKAIKLWAINSRASHDHCDQVGVCGAVITAVSYAIGY